MSGGFKIKNLNLFIAVVAGVLILDQATKAIITGSLHLSQTMEVIPGFFNIVHVKNPGAAFSIFREGGAMRTYFLILVSLAAFAILFYLVRLSSDKISAFGFSLIAGGAAGNLIDRVRIGSVTDFLEFYIRDYYWPAFNVADIAITIGVAVSVYAMYFKKQRG